MFICTVAARVHISIRFARDSFLQLVGRRVTIATERICTRSALPLFLPLFFFVSDLFFLFKDTVLLQNREFGKDTFLVKRTYVRIAIYENRSPRRATFHPIYVAR